MLINLKIYSAKREQQIDMELRERLPAHILSPCMISCQFSTKALKDYYLLTLEVNAHLSIICQRCLNSWRHPYHNQTLLAICDSDERAEELMEDYECVVSRHGQVDLETLLTDELHLYAPTCHLERSDCDNDMKGFLSTSV